MLSCLRRAARGFTRGGLRSQHLLQSRCVSRGFASHPQFTPNTTDHITEVLCQLKDAGLDLSTGSSVQSGVFNGRSWGGSGDVLEGQDPGTQQVIGQVVGGTLSELRECVDNMSDVHDKWANTPAPVRGEIVRQIGDELRRLKEPLGALVSLEMGKIQPEGEGEVQEAIDICDFACGLSRMIPGQVLPSERPEHFMMERWNPLKGHVGVITAFNFPCAVYFWNAAISMVCGNTHLWKGSDTVPYVSVACQQIVSNVLAQHGFESVATLCMGKGMGDHPIGNTIAQSDEFELVSFTGSVPVGRHVGAEVAQRFGRSLLELGGNNAMIVMDDANLDLAIPAILFSAVGTAGQRCTSLRRLYLQSGVHDEVIERLQKAYQDIPVGHQLNEGTLCGPLHSAAATDAFNQRVASLKEAGKEVYVGGEHIDQQYVTPCIVGMNGDEAEMQDELFAPVLYATTVDSLEDAVQKNNDVPQGLASSLFTTNQQDVFKWTGPLGSDCGIVNVNIGPSGAEIGGAFGGEKATGGGRESGSDSWKQYMRRSTCTVNYGDDLPLAQGIDFGGSE